MIRLRSLGECVIDLGGVRVGPESEVLFALLLYLIVERGHRVPRARLIELCWPGESDERARHNLRQALYKAKQLGAAIGQDGGDVVMPAAEVWADYDELLDSAKEGVASPVDVDKLAYLPSYQGALSETLAEWLEEQRAVVHSAVRRHLVARLARARRSAKWAEVERLARHCLTLDQMNEEAVIGLAEATAVTGSRTLAASILDTYLADLGPDAKLLGGPARELRRRILDVKGDAMDFRGTFVGRASELAVLSDRLHMASTGASTAVVLWGAAGIGKTRLVTELRQLARMRGFADVKVGCVRIERTQPLSFFIELLRALLKLPGAIGASPDSIVQLRRLVGLPPNEDRLEREDAVATPPVRVMQATAELLQAVADETPVMIVAEDVHWLDEHSAEALSELVHRSCDISVLFVLTSRQQSAETLAFVGSNSPLVVHLTRLRDDEAVQMLTSLLPRNVSDSFTQWGAAVSEGNPLFIREIAEHARIHGEIRQLPPTLDAMLRARLGALSLEQLRVLQAVSLLDKFASFEHLEALLAIPPATLIDVVDVLEQAGMIRADESGVRYAHHLIADAALGRLAPGALRLMHRRTALILERAWVSGHSTSIAWACSQHWRAAQAETRATVTTHACAQQLVALGMPGQALELLGTLRESEMPRQLLARHFELVVRAQHSAGQWRRLVANIEHMLSTNNLDDRAVMTCRLLRTHAGLRLGYPVAELLESALELACSRSLPRPFCYEFAGIAAVLADEQFNRPALNSLLEVITDANSEEDRILCDRVLLIFHSVQGELSQALTLGRSLLVRAENSGNPLEVCRALRNATIPLRISGKLSEAIQNAERAHSLALALEIPSLILQCSDCLAGLYLVVGRTQDALQTHSSTDLLLLDAEDARAKQNWLEQKARICLALGKVRQSRELIEQLDPRLMNEPGRHHNEVMSLLVRLGVAEPGLDGHADRVVELSEQVLAAAAWGSQDSCALAVADGWRSIGNEVGARRFIAEYNRRRRETYALDYADWSVSAESPAFS